MIELGEPRHEPEVKSNVRVLFDPGNHRSMMMKMVDQYRKGLERFAQPISYITGEPVERDFSFLEEGN